MEEWDWRQFLCDIQEIYRMSQSIGDNWELVSVDSETVEFTQYLRKRRKHISALPQSIDESFEININQEFHEDNCADGDPSSTVAIPSNESVIDYEFHVMFHQSYRVPTLYFIGQRSNGSPLQLEEAWRLFQPPPQGSSEHEPINMTAVITEMYHPVLNRPFLAFHPCRTAELLNALPGSTNKVLSFLSTVGPTVHLPMDHRYGLNQINDV